jgi:hypothetical protein
MAIDGRGCRNIQEWTRSIGEIVRWPAQRLATIAPSNADDSSRHTSTSRPGAAAACRCNFYATTQGARQFGSKAAAKRDLTFPFLVDTFAPSFFARVYTLLTHRFATGNAGHDPRMGSSDSGSVYRSTLPRTVGLVGASPVRYGVRPDEPSPHHATRDGESGVHSAMGAL